MKEIIIIFGLNELSPNQNLVQDWFDYFHTHFMLECVCNNLRGKLAVLIFLFLFMLVFVLMIMLNVNGYDNDNVNDNVYDAVYEDLEN